METLLAYWPFALAMMATGVASGVMAGLLGIGGGAIIVPVLATALEIMGYGGEVAQHVAVGTSLAVIVPTGIASARAHHTRGAIDFAILRLWAPVIFVATLVGGLMAGLYSGNVLRVVFAVMAFFIAANILLPFQQRLLGHLSASAATHRILAAIVGYVSALMGVGGGALSVPSIAAFGTRMHVAVGTGAAIGVFIAVAGTAGFVVSGWGTTGLPPFSVGYVNVVALVLVGSLAYLMAPVGAALAHRLEQQVLKRVFAVFLIVMGIGMIFKVVAT